ncbi:MAG: hypothetical protein E5X17_02620, partial [Mesorhizobium sp.]
MTERQKDTAPSGRKSASWALQRCHALHSLASVLRVAAQRSGEEMRFEGTAAYVADKDLMVAVNAAIALE